MLKYTKSTLPPKSKAPPDMFDTIWIHHKFSGYKNQSKSDENRKQGITDNNKIGMRLEQETKSKIESQSASKRDEPAKGYSGLVGSSTSKSKSPSFPPRISTRPKGKNSKPQKPVSKEIVDHQSDTEEPPDIDDETFYRTMKYYKKWKVVAAELEVLQREISARQIKLIADKYEIQKLRNKIRCDNILIYLAQKKKGLI